MDLIGKAFDDHGILFVRLDGSMSRPARAEVIEKFRNDPAIEVIVISIAAGGLGLNLTCAQKVYVMEPQFNPAAEAQAIDRVHRLGQKKTVTTIRYIMEDSFENKILELQQKKQDIANLSLTGKLTNKAALTRQRLKVCTKWNPDGGGFRTEKMLTVDRIWRACLSEKMAFVDIISIPLKLADYIPILPSLHSILVYPFLPRSSTLYS